MLDGGKFFHRQETPPFSHTASLLDEGAIKASNMKRVTFLTGIAAEGKRRPVGANVDNGQENQAFQKPKLLFDTGPKLCLLVQMLDDELVAGIEHRKSQWT